MLSAPTHWYGGKTFLRDFILPHLDFGKVYVEPFCGSANIFFAKRPHPIEVLNDLNPDLINFLRMLQSRRHFRLLAHRIQWTIYSVEEFMLAGRLLLDESATNIDRAWAFFVQKNLGFSGKGVTRGEWRRSFQTGGNVVVDWQNRTNRLNDWHIRLRDVHIEHMDALKVIQQLDSPDTLFYLDPPYAVDTRVDPDVYSHEMTDDAHHQLVSVLTVIQGRVILSGYDTPIYQPLEDAGWSRLDRTILSSMARSMDTLRPRTEVLWINRPNQEVSLFDFVRCDGVRASAAARAAKMKYVARFNEGVRMVVKYDHDVEQASLYE